MCTFKMVIYFVKWWRGMKLDGGQETEFSFWFVSLFLNWVAIVEHLRDPFWVWICLSPSADQRGEMTASVITLWGPISYSRHSLPRLMQSDIQIRFQNLVGFAFLISKVLCSNKFKSSSIYKSYPWNKVNESTSGIWISVPWEWFIVFESLLCFYWKA